MKSVWILLAGVFLGQTAWAKLPVQTSEEVAIRKAAAEKKAQEDAAAKVALAQAQDKVAVKYRAAHKNAPVPVPITDPLAVKK